MGLIYFYTTSSSKLLSTFELVFGDATLNRRKPQGKGEGEEQEADRNQRGRTSQGGQQQFFRRLGTLQSPRGADPGCRAGRRPSPTALSPSMTQVPLAPVKFTHLKQDLATKRLGHRNSRNKNALNNQGRKMNGSN